MAIDPNLDPELLKPWLRRDALAQGYDDRSIGRFLASREWHRIRHGAFTGGQLWRSLGPEDQHRVRARAVLRTAHPTSVLSHVSAAVELGAPTYDVDLTQVHLTRTDGHPGRKAAGVVHHCGELPVKHLIERNGVRLVDGNRAAIEVATVTEVESTLVIVNGLLNAAEASMEKLLELAAATKHWPNSLRTDLVLRLADRRIASAGESRVFFLCWRRGIPMPEPQFEVHDDRGRVVALCDFAWPEHGVFVEFDGRVKYERLLKPGQNATDAMLAQQQREELICRLTGWVCIRLTWADLARPEATARRIRQLLASRSTAA